MGRNRRSEYRYIPGLTPTPTPRRSFRPTRTAVQMLTVAVAFIFFTAIGGVLYALFPTFIVLGVIGYRNRRRTARTRVTVQQVNNFDPRHPYDGF